MRIEDKPILSSYMMTSLPLDESDYFFLDLQKGQLTFFKICWIKIVNGKYPFIE